jgi:hypothetical protein
VASAIFFHYAVGAAIWGAFNRRNEKRGVSLEEDFKAPPSINYITSTLFWGKVGFSIAGYSFLLWHFAGLLRIQPY